MKRDHHYVPQLYLRYFASSDRQVWAYRTLVSHPKVHRWKRASTKGLAWQRNLYTRVIGVTESDELEQYLDRNYESPAAAALQKAVNLARLSPDDWALLARFVAAQDVRTPFTLQDMIQSRSRTIESDMDAVLEKTVARLEAHARGVRKIELPTPIPHSDLVPMRVERRLDPTTGDGEIALSLGLGRGYWHFAIYHLLENTAPILEKHRWTLLTAPDGIQWPTSDRPVIKLNANGIMDYDFRGGWGKTGGEIMLPLSPRVLLYTRVGDRSPPRKGSALSMEVAAAVRKMIVEHGHRHIYAASPMEEVEAIRPRKVDPTRYKEERDKWKNWHSQQTELEAKFRRGDD